MKRRHDSHLKFHDPLSRGFSNWSSPRTSLVLEYSVEVSTRLGWQTTCKSIIHLIFSVSFNFLASPHHSGSRYYITE